MDIPKLRDLSCNLASRVEELYAATLSSDPEDMHNAKRAAQNTLVRISAEIFREDQVLMQEINAEAATEPAPVPDPVQANSIIEERIQHNVAKADVVPEPALPDDGTQPEPPDEE